MRWQTTEVYFRQLLAQKLGIPVLGNIFFVAPVNTQYDSWMRREMDIPAELMFTNPLNAFNAVTAAKNDVILFAPGAYAVTASLAWNKSNVHAIGLAGPRSWSDYSEYGVSIYTTTAAIAEAVNVTGNYCQFHGMNFANNGANTGNLAALVLAGYGGIMKGCSFDGAMNTTNDVAAAAAVYIHTGAHDYLFEDCRIGDASWWSRDVAASGQLAFTGQDSYNGIFRDCLFQVQSVTSTVCLVRIATQAPLRLDTIFDRCVFTNQYLNWGGTLASVFYHSGAALQTCRILLKNCCCSGFDEWQTSDYQSVFQSNMGVATVGGGICIEPTATIS
jgi:hypothetical protein